MIRINKTKSGNYNLKYDKNTTQKDLLFAIGIMTMYLEEVSKRDLDKILGDVKSLVIEYKNINKEK